MTQRRQRPSPRRLCRNTSRPTGARGGGAAPIRSAVMVRWMAAGRHGVDRSGRRGRHSRRGSPAIAFRFLRGSQAGLACLPACDGALAAAAAGRSRFLWLTFAILLRCLLHVPEEAQFSRMTIQVAVEPVSRNDAGLAAALPILAERFGDRLVPFRGGAAPARPDPDLARQPAAGCGGLRRIDRRRGRRSSASAPPTACR